MFGQMMNPPFFMGCCCIILVVLFVLAALLDIRSRKEVRFRDFAAAYDQNLKLPSASVYADDSVDILQLHLASLHNQDSGAAEGRETPQGIVENSADGD